jgi:RimJ/RimL family protein N-acetyltransferase
MVDWNGTVVLTTPRLLLRTFRLADLAQYAALNADPVVMEYLGGVLSPERSDQIAEWAQLSYARYAMGLLAVERRKDALFVGMCGLHHQDWYPDDIEIGWRLAREHWGQGYATEAATAWLDYAFDSLRLARVISIADVPNVRSREVMERLSMTLDHEAELLDDGVAFQAAVYAISADQWRNRRSSIPSSPPP